MVYLIGLFREVNINGVDSICPVFCFKRFVFGGHAVFVTAENNKYGNLFFYFVIATVYLNAAFFL